MWGGRSSPPPAPLRVMNGATLNYFKGGITQAVVSKRRRFTRRPGKQHGKIISINSHPSSRAISKHNLEPRHYCFSTSSAQLSDAHWMNMMPLSWTLSLSWELTFWRGDVAYKRGNSIFHVPRGVSRGVIQHALLWGRESPTHVHTSRNQIDAGRKWNRKNKSFTVHMSTWQREGRRSF